MKTATMKAVIERRVALVLAVAAGLLVISSPRVALAQETAAQETADPRAEDIASTEGIISALYGSISGGKDVPRDWPRFRSLFLQGGLMVPTGTSKRTGDGYANVLSVDTYIRNATSNLMRRGFFEREVHRVEERYGAIAHVFSTYEARVSQDDPEPFMRGINSIQLFHDGERWWILSVFWDSEGPENPIPAKYLPGGGG